MYRSIHKHIQDLMTQKPELWLTWTLSALMVLLMGTYGVVQVMGQQQELQAAEERRGIALARGLSLIGATAVMENLFVVQEAIMSEVTQDPEILSILVIDKDHMVIASSDLKRIGETFHSPVLQDAKANPSKLSLVRLQGQHHDRLVIFSALQAEGALLGWTRVELSLERVRQDAHLNLAKQIGMSLLVLLFAVILVRKTVGRLSYSLKTSEAKTHLIIENALDAVVGMDDQGRVTDWNSKAESMFGWTKQEILGDELTNFIIPPDYRDGHREGLRQFLLTGKGSVLNTRVEVPALTRDGKLLTVELSISPIQSAAGWSFHAFLRDVTQRKSMEENLIRLGAFPQNNPNPIIQTNLQAEVTYLNPSAAERFPGLEIGRADHPFLSGLSEIIALFLEGSESTRNIERTFQGTSYDIKISYVAEAKAVTWYVHDVTKRKQVEEALSVSRDEALASARAKADFLATMSHEIRTPMNGVIGMTGLLLDTPLNAEQRHFANTVRSSGEALLTIINDILDFSKIESGKLEFETIDFDLRVCVDETLELLAEKASKKRLELVGHVFADVPTALRGDPGRLRQVLLNLLGNGIKFSRVGEVSAGIFRLDENDHSVMIRCQITDTGVGIPSDIVSRLFQPFTQADSSTTRQFGGTGLGLAICKQLVEQMGGEIGVDSTPGQGSQFWFTARLEKQPPGREKPVYTVKNLEGLRVCCVDDHPTNRFLLAQYCLEWGMDAVVAATPTEALWLLQGATAHGKPFDLAIVDMEMPEMDGKGLAEVIKRNSAIENVRLVLLTSLAQRGEAEKARHAGFAGYLTKPVRKEKLRQCLEMVMGLSDYEAKEADHPLITQHSQRAIPRVANSRILVADDHTVNQQLAALMLERMGHRVDVVANGQEAVEAIIRKPYDMVFMDCQMPEMDGYEATREIRKREALNVKREASFEKDETQNVRDLRPNTLHASRNTLHVPIIAMTANAMDGDREKCLAAGMDDYVSKPIRTEDLERVLIQWLPRKSEDGEPGAMPLVAASSTSLRQANSQTHVNEESSIDPNVLAEWQAMTGEGYPAFLARMVQQFIQDAGQCVQEVQRAIANGDMVQLAEAAHGLKGVSGNMGMKRLAELSFELEQNGKNEHGDQNEELCHQLEWTFQQAQREFYKEIEKQALK
jgi:PAS domain S-box-containing protein